VGENIMIGKKRYFWRNTSARVPFSIFGIFLLLGSSVTTVLLYEHGIQRVDSKTMHYSIQSIDQLLSEAEIDVSTLLNHLSMNALYDIGLSPVMVSNDPSYSAEEINQYRLKCALLEDLPLYLSINYQNNSFQNGKSAVNVALLTNDSHPSFSIEDIDIQTVQMMMHRPMNLPYVSPPQTKSHQTYWILRIPLCFEVVSLESDEILLTSTRTLSTVITSRYPLLYSLLQEYNETINGLGPLWSLTTILSNMYSLARGYKHYQTGIPENVVDNRHLDPLVNVGLLLQSGFVFGSIDPFALINVTSSIKKAVYHMDSPTSLDSFNNVTDSSFDISLQEFSTVSANVDAGDPVETEIDQNPHVDISAIASQPLYTLQTLSICFQNDNGMIDVPIELQDDESQIQEIIDEYLDETYSFCGIQPGVQTTNISTSVQVQDILSDMYSAMMHIQVNRDADALIMNGAHDGFPIDNGTDPWSISQVVCTNELSKPQKGTIANGSILYGTIYDITWSCVHHWSRRIEQYSDNVTHIIWETYQTYDTKYEHNVSIHVILDEYSTYLNLKNDVSDILYYNFSEFDTNLEDSLTTYIRNIYNTSLDVLLKEESGMYHQTRINATIPPWVEEESWDALYDIYEMICAIEQDESINSLSYPDPTVLMQKTFDDILTKYTQNMTMYLQRQSYVWDDDMFLSVGLKAVYGVRLWYVYHLEEKIRSVFTETIDAIDSSITTALQNHSDIQADELHRTLNTDVDSLFGSFITIPLGLDMLLTSESSESIQQWNESIRLAVTQFPSHLTAFEKVEYEGKKEFFLGVQNICLLGPTGLPLLPPTPATPWIVTLNLWVISFKGSYASFEISDCLDETIYHPLFGHQPQRVLRKDQLIYDEGRNLLGMNTRISFSFDTVSTSLVPAFGLMVGDTKKDIIESNGLTYE
jgi:hypothetical protein